MPKVTVTFKLDDGFGTRGKQYDLQFRPLTLRQCDDALVVPASPVHVLATVGTQVTVTGIADGPWEIYGLGNVRIAITIPPSGGNIMPLILSAMIPINTPTDRIATAVANYLAANPVTALVSSVAGKTGAVTLAKGDVGLGNVDNTADAAKPVSAATQAALDAKASVASVSSVASSVASKISRGSYLDVREQFGAVGDGTTDNTAAFTAAINAAASATLTGATGVVVIPSGRYVTGPLTLPNRVALVGLGVGVSQIIRSSTATTTGPFITTSTTARAVQIRDLTIDGNFIGDGTSTGLYLNTTGTQESDVANGAVQWIDGRHYVSNLLIQNTKGSGLKQAGRGTVEAIGVVTWLCDGHGFDVDVDSHYSGCDAKSSGLDGFIVRSGGNRFTGCKAWHSGRISTTGSETDGTGHGWHIANGNYSANAYSACEAQDNKRAGFVLKNAARQVFSACNSNSNNTADLGHCGVEVVDSYVNRWEGIAWDRAANAKRQLAALRVSGGSQNVVRVTVDGKSNMAQGSLSADTAVGANRLELMDDAGGQGWPGAGGGSTVTSTQITDSTAVGRSVLTAVDAAAARAAIGAGTGSGTALVSSVAGKTGAVTLAKGDVGLGNVDNTADAAKPVSAATQAALDAKTVTAEKITDSTAVGRSLLTAVDAAAAREAIGAGTGSGNATTPVLSEAHMAAREQVVPATTVFTGNTKASSFTSPKTILVNDTSKVQVIGCDLARLVRRGSASEYFGAAFKTPEGGGAKPVSSTGAPASTSAFGVEFWITPGSVTTAFEVILYTIGYPRGGWVSLRINDRKVTDLPQTIPGVNQANRLKFTLPQAFEPTKVTLTVVGLAIGPIYAPAESVVTPSTPRSMYALGDSMVQGDYSHSADEIGTVLGRAMSMLGYTSWWNGSIRGTAPIEGGSVMNYQGRSANDFFGGVDFVLCGTWGNDILNNRLGSDSAAAMVTVFNNLRNTQPGVPIVCWGPYDPKGNGGVGNAATDVFTSTQTWASYDTAYRNACAANNVSYIAGYNGSVYGPTGALIGNTGQWVTPDTKLQIIGQSDPSKMHPSDVGVSVVAVKLARALAMLGYGQI